MSNTDFIQQQFHHLQTNGTDEHLQAIRHKAFNDFKKMGIPATKHEEWRYTRVGGLFDKAYQFADSMPATTFPPEDLAAIRLPGHEAVSVLFFINGIFSYPLSIIRSETLLVMPLEDAAKSEYGNIVSTYFGDSSNYLKDGINALNTALMQGAVFIHVKRGPFPELPVYVYNITDASSANIFAQPRSLFYIGEHAQLQLVETYTTIGQQESFTNQVMEIIVEKEARLEYYKIQNDAVHTNLVSTTHIRQLGKSYIHAVTISLDGGMVRNNLNIIMDAAHSEAHLFGLYFLKGQTHIDNHTLVDNVKPDCFSNELYKGIIDDSATGVFNGKIFVRPLAQKTNAYQSNKNVLLSDTASVNSKPQLEIFADDVKCSHGCTVGQLNEEGLFYLQSRGISEKIARSLLLHAFAADIPEQIKPAPIREYVNNLISKRLEFNIT